MPYLVEAGNLFAAGASVTDLDEAMLDFGMPMGPLRLLDEVGIDVALHVAGTLAASFQDRMIVPELLSKMVQAGLLGRKSGRGFYIYPKGKDPTPNPQVISVLSVSGDDSPSLGGQSGSDGEGRGEGDCSISSLQQRMVFLMINEAARCLEERIVTEPADVDFAMIMGTGFAPFRGGPLRYADSLGEPKLVSEMELLVASGAKHFAPCRLLRDMANQGTKFYSEK
jgi:3-hydroxyacyl-CoA dehydrogenase/enoyl-CoA hydratase/3-hydroxybutyryl-CoA epimerase